MARPSKQPLAVPYADGLRDDCWVAQLVERLIVNQDVAGSSPAPAVMDNKQLPALLEQVLSARAKIKAEVNRLSFERFLLDLRIQLLNRLADGHVNVTVPLNFKLNPTERAALSGRLAEVEIAIAYEDAVRVGDQDSITVTLMPQESST